MKRHEPESDEMKEEYDFSKSVRSPYAAMAGELHLVTIDADVHEAFPDSDSVNDALRLLLKAAKSAQLPKAS